MGFFDFLKNKPELTDEKSNNQNLTNNLELKTHLESIQNEIFLFLKPLGFKKKGRAFNRQTEDGIYQVINIQSGRYEFDDKYVIPGFRENLYGNFTVNLGVMVREIYELDSHNKPKNIYQDYDCQIRERLPHLTIKQDHWWSISDDNNKTAKEVINGLSSHGLDWLDNFENRDKICRNLGNLEGDSPRAKLNVALIEFHRDKSKAEKLFQDYYNKIKIKNGHKEYVKGLADRLGVILKD
ncbi:DUF4304 domain-containing protein [Kaistella flava (ex Peng et al. 2021)]|uniref:DUF4304 domain-containing protein n=1 Tax=Kaistella flava (ex Peng et al. 2021) TaxID=2038776 RepID=A0A7M2Y652_9FLAO|nr:DUF4304 domain-containing protein [Kaistella flava (ex Peng et al. 2021)]QOW09570.1 DUF4304 domain-containing protein [Kaistella flava (ex Peng et al. 2021)]